MLSLLGEDVSDLWREGGREGDRGEESVGIHFSVILTEGVVVDDTDTGGAGELNK